jgi:hypothetical protein
MRFSPRGIPVPSKSVWVAVEAAPHVGVAAGALLVAVSFDALPFFCRETPAQFDLLSSVRRAGVADSAEAFRCVAGFAAPRRRHSGNNRSARSRGAGALRAIAQHGPAFALVVVTPIRSSVSKPIIAASDDAALFELLASVGGRMTA